MPTVSQRWDIKSLFEQYTNIDVVSKATVHGVLEYHSNCPKCPGSKDSFILQPEIGRFSHAIRSNGCNWTGDAIDLLTDPIVGMSHQEAREMLDLQDKDFVSSSPSKSHQDDNESPPPARWQETGKLLVERAMSALWSSSGRDMLDYLHARGLGD